MERRLAAILAADLAGYAGLVDKDETGTLARLKALRQEVIEPLVATHNGRIVKVMGDGFLVEFQSVLNAVECAIAWQTDTLADDMRFRIGINLGDVIHEDGDIFGDGVNVAARLEGLAAPGGICVSASVYDTVKNKLPLAVTDLGPRKVKNIAAAVHVYTIDPGAAAAAVSETPVDSGRPAVAVLPFANLSGDPEQDYFSDGLTEDIITSLAAWHYFPVISRNSSFVFRGQAVDVKRVARELGARYVLEGSVRKGGERLRITAQLIDAETDHHIWAERYDRSLEDMFALQDEIAQRIAATLAPELEKAEGRRAESKHPDSFDAWDCYQRGAALLFRFTKDGNEEARRMFAAAIDREPGYSKAFTGLAYSYHRDLFWNLVDDRATWIARFHDAARRAVDLDDRDSSAHQVLGYANLWKGDYDLAIAEERRAVALHPGNAFAHESLGEVLDLSGRSEEAIPHSRLGCELNQQDPRVHTFIGAVARVYLNARRYREAEDWARRALERRADYPPAQLYLASTLGHQDRTEEARVVLEGCERLLPGFATIYKNPADTEHFLDGLRRAGWAGRITASGALSKEMTQGDLRSK